MGYKTCTRRYGSSPFRIHTKAERSLMMGIWISGCIILIARSAFGEISPTVKTIAGRDEITQFDFLADIHRAHIRSDAQISKEGAFGGLQSTESGLILEENSSLTYNIFIPRESNLFLLLDQVWASFSQIEIRAESDDGPSINLVRDAVDGEVSVPLSAFTGKAAAISLRALMGDVQLKDARLLRSVFEEPESVQLPVVKNVLVILIDTLRRDRLKTYNRSTNVYAPGLKRLSEQSLVFDNAIAQSNWTKPSTATLLSGLYPLSHTANTHAAILPNTTRTLPVLLQKQGFTTGGFVANGYISEQFGFGLGWDYLGMYDTKREPSKGRHLFSELIRWIRHQPKNQRFFAYLHTTDVHAPYRSPRRIWSRYDPAQYRGGVRPAQTVSLINQVRAGTLVLAWRDMFRLTALYNGAVSYHDHAIGHLMQSLKQLRVLDDTVVVLTSDHGEEFFDHGSVGHGHTLYEELVDVPLLIRFPGRLGIAPRHIGDMVGLIDVVPTLCELLQVNPPDEVQGVSMVPLATGDRSARRNGVVISESPSHHAFALQNDRFKVIINKNTVTLYDKRIDPSETVDQSQYYPITLTVMTDILEDHLRGLKVWQNRFAAHDKSDNNATKSDSIDADTQTRLRALGYLDD
jgi:choline-sulfatase